MLLVVSDTQSIARRLLNGWSSTVGVSASVSVGVGVGVLLFENKFKNTSFEIELVSVPFCCVCVCLRIVGWPPLTELVGWLVGSLMSI